MTEKEVQTLNMKPRASHNNDKSSQLSIEIILYLSLDYYLPHDFFHIWLRSFKIILLINLHVTSSSFPHYHVEINYIKRVHKSRKANKKTSQRVTTSLFGCQCEMSLQ